MVISQDLASVELDSVAKEQASQQIFGGGQLGIAHLNQRGKKVTLRASVPVPNNREIKRISRLPHESQLPAEEIEDMESGDRDEGSCGSGSADRFSCPRGHLILVVDIRSFAVAVYNPDESIESNSIATIFALRHLQQNARMPPPLWRRRRNGQRVRKR